MLSDVVGFFLIMGMVFELFLNKMIKLIVEQLIDMPPSKFDLILIFGDKD